MCGARLSNLPEYLEQKREAIQHRRKWLGDAPENYTAQIQASANAEGRSGIRRIRIRDFQFISDSPPNFAGYNLGPTSPELLMGALASCLTHTYLVQAADLQISLESVFVEISACVDMRAGTPRFGDAVLYPYDIRFKATIKSDSEYIVQLNESVEKFCPILNLLRRENKVTGEINRI